MTRQSLVTSIAVCLVGCGTGASLPPPDGATSIDATTSVASERLPCDPHHVSLREGAIRITPRGSDAGDDTANLQCALDVAIARGKPTTVDLAAGTFHTAQLVAHGFAGRLRGAGIGRTTLSKVAGPLRVTPVDFYLAGEPSASNPWPSLIAFVDGDFSVSDLAIQILDGEPTTGWSIFGSPTIRALAHAVVVVGSSARASFERVQVVGAPAPSDPYVGMSIYNAIFFEGFLPGLAPLSGELDVRGCEFVDVAWGAVVQNVTRSRISIVGNTASGTLAAVQLIDLDRSEARITGNRLAAGSAFDGFSAGIQVLDGCLGGGSVCGVVDTELLIAGDRLSAFDGIEVLATFGGDVECRIAGNAIDYDVVGGGSAVWLGPGTRGCFVSTGGTVKDEGIGNRVVPRP
jgi:hypothetical protein